MMNPSTVMTAISVELVVKTTSRIVPNVECALIKRSFTTIVAKWESTRPNVLFAMKIFFHQEVNAMNCHVVILCIGNVIVIYLLMIYDVQFVRRLC